MLLFAFDILVFFMELFLHVKVFRSIDSASVKGFPEDPKEATTKVKHKLCILASLCYMEKVLDIVLTGYFFLFFFSSNFKIYNRTWYVGRMC